MKKSRILLLLLALLTGSCGLISEDSLPNTPKKVDAEIMVNSEDLPPRGGG